MKTYRIVRTYTREELEWCRSPRIIARGLSLAAAKAHCRDPQTHHLAEDGSVEWFDGFEEDR